MSSGKLSNSFRKLTLQKQKCRLTHRGEGKDSNRQAQTHPARTCTVHPAGAELSSDSRVQTGTPPQIHRNNLQPCSPPQAQTHTRPILPLPERDRPSPELASLLPHSSCPHLSPYPSFPCFWLLRRMWAEKEVMQPATVPKQPRLASRGGSPGSHTERSHSNCSGLINTAEHCRGGAKPGRANHARLRRRTPPPGSRRPQPPSRPQQRDPSSALRTDGLPRRESLERHAPAGSAVGRRHRQESGRAGSFIGSGPAPPSPPGRLRAGSWGISARCGGSAAAPSCLPACGCTVRRTG